MVSADASVLGIINITKALAFRLNVDVLLPLYRPVLGITELPGKNQVIVFEPAWLAARAGAGVELHFR